jgi:hypothetical protein
MRVRKGRIGAVVRVRRKGRLAEGQQSTAQSQLFFADSIAEETELADADHSGGQHVQQKAAEELDRIQGHGLGTAAIRVVLPRKADSAIFQREQAVIGNGHAVSVASQILENALRSAKGRLNVDHPFRCGCFFTQRPERIRLGQRTEFAGEAERALAESLFQLVQELLAEAAAENAHG